MEWKPFEWGKLTLRYDVDDGKFASAALSMDIKQETYLKENTFTDAVNEHLSRGDVPYDVLGVTDLCAQLRE